VDRLRHFSKLGQHRYLCQKAAFSAPKTLVFMRL
jgi:hypothetical protein